MIQHSLTIYDTYYVDIHRGGARGGSKNLGGQGTKCGPAVIMFDR